MAIVVGVLTGPTETGLRIRLRCGIGIAVGGNQPIIVLEFRRGAPVAWRGE